MAVKDDPRTVIKAAHAGAFLKAHDLKAVVIIAVRKDGWVDTATWGETEFDCRTIGDWAKRTMDHILSVVPFQTAFGWGNGGKPKALTPKDMASLTSRGRAFAIKNTHKDAEWPDDTVEPRPEAQGAR